MYRNPSAYFFFFLLNFIFSLHAEAQKADRDSTKNQKKYPSLLWEISGNGLQKPSYLFGTMHVSNKLVFHLNDSFYSAIREVETVALELDPKNWQDQLADLNSRKWNYNRFSANQANRYYNKESFSIADYLDELKLALKTEPEAINSLLYRSSKVKEDFEEDTFLDLYIYQTGMKLGKHTTGVEDFFEADKATIEAYIAMSKEKKKKKELSNDFYRTYTDKIQDAYRKGDLDELMNLDLQAEQSEAYREVFINQRNVKQAKSIDSILKSSSLFVGVGAAHLPGSKGVIEILRSMGYTMRPIIMNNQNATFQDKIDQQKVPVKFFEQTAEDGAYSVMVPGNLLDLQQEGSFDRLDRKQYADMANGSYYMVTRIQTHAAFLGQRIEDVLKKIDSLLYENIPGKILSRERTKNGFYNRIDVRNKTRRGDHQRYSIFVTPAEIIIFKMSGKGEYISGEEGEKFFNSIFLAPPSQKESEIFAGPQNNFLWKFPVAPHVYRKKTGHLDRWEYSSVDTTNGDAWMVLQSGMYNDGFIDPDSFSIWLAGKSLEYKLNFESKGEKTITARNGHPGSIFKYKMKDGDYLNAGIFLKGQIVFIAMIKSRDSIRALHALESFDLPLQVYQSPEQYVDTTLNFEMSMYQPPKLDLDLREVVERMKETVYASDYSENYWSNMRYASLADDKTGETVLVQSREFPQYYHIPDINGFWATEMEEQKIRTGGFISGQPIFESTDSSEALSFQISDTASYKMIYKKIVVAKNHYYSLTAMGDTLNGLSPFGGVIFRTFKPYGPAGRDLHKSMSEKYFQDFFSNDTAVVSKARKFVSNLKYYEEDVSKIVDAINRISVSDKEYYSLKTKLIAELGYIKDSNYSVVPALMEIYSATADTSLFQNEVIYALARHKSSESFRELKTLLINEPPVFTNNYMYSSLFRIIDDSLNLAATLIPDILPLASVADYKQPVFNLIEKLVDSGYIKKKKYKKLLNEMLVDAWVNFRKMKVRNEEISLKAREKKEDEVSSISSYSYPDNSTNGFSQLTSLMAPFYSSEPRIRQFFDKLLASPDNNLRFAAVSQMIKGKQHLPQQVIYDLAKDSVYAYKLYSVLFDNKRIAEFPADLLDEVALGKSAIYNIGNFTKLDSIEYLGKRWVQLKSETGWLMLYKYRQTSVSQWRLAAIGLQSPDPLKVLIQKENSWISRETMDVEMTLEEQIDDLVCKMIAKSWPGGRFFYQERYF